VKLRELLQYNLKTMRAYLLKEDFQRFWTYRSPAWAGKFLDCWCTDAMRSKLEPMKEMAGTLRRHRELLLNWFCAKGEISSGSVEGMNTKAKVALRKSYGFKTLTIGKKGTFQSRFRHSMAPNRLDDYIRAKALLPTLLVATSIEDVLVQSTLTGTAVSMGEFRNMIREPFPIKTYPKSDHFRVPDF